LWKGISKSFQLILVLLLSLFEESVISFKACYFSLEVIHFLRLLLPLFHASFALLDAGSLLLRQVGIIDTHFAERLVRRCRSFHVGEPHAGFIYCLMVLLNQITSYCSPTGCTKEQTLMSPFVASTAMVKPQWWTKIPSSSQIGGGSPFRKSSGISWKSLISKFGNEF
jgi:hypothetical protein